MKRTAFTLAEVLIALMIIAIVAGLSLPSLMKLHQQASLGHQLASVQFTFEEALGRVQLNNPTTSLKELNTAQKLEAELRKYLIVTAHDSDILKNGFEFEFKAGSGNIPSGTALKNVKIDINSNNLPNKDGIDKFEFVLTSRGMAIPQGCAAMIADNNWKLPKDYDASTCNTYNSDYSSSGS